MRLGKEDHDPYTIHRVVISNPVNNMKSTHIKTVVVKLVVEDYLFYPGQVRFSSYEDTRNKVRHKRIDGILNAHTRI